MKLNRKPIVSDAQCASEVKKILSRCDEIERAYDYHGRRAIIVLEGWDGSGKSGVISRLMQGFSSDFCRVWHIKKPMDHEEKLHYLYRFWQKLPNPGTIAVFDRSWYGRVVAEPMSGGLRDERRKDAYREIKEFERMLVADGVVIVKIFLHFSVKEMEERLFKRIEDGKAHKITKNDLFTLGRYADFMEAFGDMIDFTHEYGAKWNVIDATDKNRTRIDAVKYIIEQLSSDIEQAPQSTDLALAKEILDHFGDRLMGAKCNYFIDEIKRQLGGFVPATPDDRHLAEKLRSKMEEIAGLKQ
jgi:polyphosphate kinase 2 (PPK2 family)